MKLSKSDLTFRMTTRTGEAIVSRNGESICNTFQRLLYMVPGTDDYEKNMGLDITTRAKKPHVNGERDTEYEAKIVEQLYAYTDIVPLNIVAIFQDQILIIYMDCMIDNQEFRLQASSDSDKLATQILPKTV